MTLVVIGCVSRVTCRPFLSERRVEGLAAGRASWPERPLRLSVLIVAFLVRLVCV